MGEKPVRSSPAALRLLIPCDLGQVRAAAHAAHEFLASQGCSEAELADCELALVEACNNAIEHATKKGREQPVVVEILCDEKEMELRVTDQTKGFDWPRRAALPKAESESGRGVFLMQSLMDYANYFRSDAENTLVLRKKRKGRV
jgi:anti-sigma regulatory factor (Ser/Thr protein kinase)